MFSVSISPRIRTHGLQLRCRCIPQVTVPLARLAGVNRFEMRNILREESVELRFGPEDMETARDEIESARNSDVFRKE